MSFFGDVIISFDGPNLNSPSEDKFLIGKILLGCIVIICAICLFTSFYKVNEQEQAVITRFGKVVKTETAGPHLKIPFVDKIQKVNTTTQGLQIGYREVEESEKSSLSELFGSRPSEDIISVPEESLMITSDFNFVNVDFYLEYKVSDAATYLYTSDEPENILRNIAQACIRTIVSNYTVDDVITTGKNQIQSDVKDMIINELAKNDIGVQIVNLQIQDAEPPSQEIMVAFESVEQERQNKDTTINNAKKYANERIPQAEAEYDKIMQTAEANKAARISEAEGQVARFNNMYEEYIKYPAITKQRMFYESMNEILPKADLIITDGTSETLLPLDDFAQ